MKRMSSIALLVFTLLVLSSCTSTHRRPGPIPLKVVSQKQAQLFTIDITREALETAGYRHGDFILLEIDGIMLRTVYNNVVVNSYITLIADEKQSTLYMPKAVKEGSTGILFLSKPPERQSNSSVSFSGNFVFTF